MTTQTGRPAVFAAQGWYPNTRHDVEAMLAEFEPAPESERGPAFGVIAPHAGWRYSGEVAFKAYTAVEPFPARVLILCTAHRVASPEIALWPSDGGDWDTPLGPVAIDATLTEHLLRECSTFAASARAHMHEHAAELQLPLLQHRRPDVRVAIATVAMHPRATPLERMLMAGAQLGQALAKLAESSSKRIDSSVGMDTHDSNPTRPATSATEAREPAMPVGAAGIDAARNPHTTRNSDVLVVCSSDLSHEDNDATTRQQDELALAAIRTGDPCTLYEAVRDNDITMCGAGAAVILLEAARHATHSTTAPGPRAAAPNRPQAPESNTAAPAATCRPLVYRTSADTTHSPNSYSVGYTAATVA